MLDLPGSHPRVLPSSRKPSVNVSGLDPIYIPATLCRYSAYLSCSAQSPASNPLYVQNGTYTFLHVHVWISACMQARVCVWGRVRVCVRVRACLRVCSCMSACMHVCLHLRLPTELPCWNLKRLIQIESLRRSQAPLQCIRKRQYSSPISSTHVKKILARPHWQKDSV